MILLLGLGFRDSDLQGVGFRVEGIRGLGIRPDWGIREFSVWGVWGFNSSIPYQLTNSKFSLGGHA